MQQYQYHQENTFSNQNHLNDLLNSEVNQEQLMSSNRNLVNGEKDLEQSALRKASQIVNEKNQQNMMALKQSQFNLEQKKEKMKKYYEEFIGQLDQENEGLQKQLRQLKSHQIQQNSLEQSYHQMKLQYEQSLNNQGSTVDLRNMQKTLKDLQNEKQRLIDLLEVEKEKLNELHKVYDHEHIEYETSENKTLQREIQHLKSELKLKQDPIIKEIIVERDAPERTEIIYEEIPEEKIVTRRVIPTYTYKATCNCGCKCHRTSEYYTSHQYLDNNTTSIQLDQPYRTSVYRSSQIPVRRSIIRKSYQESPQVREYSYSIRNGRINSKISENSFHEGNHFH